MCTTSIWQILGKCYGQYRIKCNMMVLPRSGFNKSTHTHNYISIVQGIIRMTCSFFALSLTLSHMLHRFCIFIRMLVSQRISLMKLHKILVVKCSRQRFERTIKKAAYSEIEQKKEFAHIISFNLCRIRRITLYEV